VFQAFLITILKVKNNSTAYATQVFLLIVIDGNLDEKSLFLAAIDTATWRATAL
jgi:hypothetical protein